MLNYLFVENPLVLQVLIFCFVALVAIGGLIFHWLFGGFSGDDSKEGPSVGLMAFFLAWGVIGLVMTIAYKMNGFLTNLFISFILALSIWLAVDAIILLAKKALDKRHSHKLLHQH